MTPQEAFNLIRGRMGGRLPENTLNGYILQELNAVQEELQMMPLKPWFLRKRETLSYSGGTFPLPGDFGRLDENEPIEYASGASTATLKRRPYDELYEKIVAADDALPEFYDIIGVEGAMVLHVFGAVTVGTVTLTYLCDPEPIAAETDDGNVWYEYAGPLLAHRAGAIIANLYMGDQARGQWFDAQAKIAHTAMLHSNVAHEMVDSFHSEQVLPS